MPIPHTPPLAPVSSARVGAPGAGHCRSRTHRRRRRRRSMAGLFLALAAAAGRAEAPMKRMGGRAICAAAGARAAAWPMPAARGRAIAYIMTALLTALRRRSSGCQVREMRPRPFPSPNQVPAFFSRRRSTTRRRMCSFLSLSPPTHPPLHPMRVRFLPPPSFPPRSSSGLLSQPRTSLRVIKNAGSYATAHICKNAYMDRSSAPASGYIWQEARPGGAYRSWSACR